MDKQPNPCEGTDGIDWEAVQAEQTTTETPDTLGELSKLVEKMLESKDRVEALEEKLKEEKAVFRQYNEVTIPDLLMELGLTELKHSSGFKLTLTKFYSAKISPENAPAAFTWLETTGNGSIVKTDVGLKFGMGEAEKAQSIITTMHELGFMPTVKTAVHPSTLKAFVKEQVESGNVDFPQDLFSVYIGNKIKIK